MVLDHPGDVHDASATVIGLLVFVALQAATSEVVVSGQRLDDSYAECVAGKCPLLRDAQVSIAKGEQLLRDGRYLPAKRLLAEAISRNRRFAKTNPKSVAALYEAFATVSLQEGDKNAFREAVGEQVRTLRENLPPNDPLSVQSGISLGDMWMKVGNPKSADVAYKSAEEQGRSAGLDRIQIAAMLRRAWIAVLQRQFDRANALMAAVEKSSLGQEPDTRASVAAIRSRMNPSDGKIEQDATALAGQDAAGDPRLLRSPPARTDAASTPTRPASEPDVHQAQASDSSAISWADIGFWVRPDGYVEKAEVRRGSRNLSWARPILAQIAARRYAALVNPPTPDGLYRIERYTLRGTYQQPIGSRLGRRSGAAKIEMLDLTDDPRAPPPEK